MSTTSEATTDVILQLKARVDTLEVWVVVLSVWAVGVTIVLFISGILLLVP